MSVFLYFLGGEDPTKMVFLSEALITFFLSWVSKTQPNHWNNKRMVSTKLPTSDPRNSPSNDEGISLNDFFVLLSFAYYNHHIVYTPIIAGLLTNGAQK